MLMYNTAVYMQHSVCRVKMCANSIVSASYTDDCQECHLQSRAVFVEAVWKQEKFCNYGHALATYGLLRNNENTSQTLNNMLDDLRSRIVISKACKSVENVFNKKAV